jgi:hypothetical protein
MSRSKMASGVALVGYGSAALLLGARESFVG